MIRRVAWPLGPALRTPCSALGPRRLHEVFARALGGDCGVLYLQDDPKYDIYKNDFGMQYVHLSRDIPTDTLAIMQMARWAVSWLTGRHPKMVPIGRRGDKTECYIVGEDTLDLHVLVSDGYHTQSFFCHLYDGF